MKKILMMMAIATATFTACKKSDDAPAQLEVTATNIAGVYRITASVEVIGGVTYDRFNGGNVGGLAYPSDYETCEKDDTFTFSATGTVTNAEGATSCTPPTSSATFPYTLNTTAKTISVLGQTSTIKSLTSTTMVLETTSATSVETVTFSK